MSHWTYVSGLIRVSPTGRTQPEKRYVLETVLEHLPAVSGSEGYMDTYIIQKKVGIYDFLTMNLTNVCHIMKTNINQTECKVSIL